jgi:hypothetical protein
MTTGDDPRVGGGGAGGVGDPARAGGADVTRGGDAPSGYSGGTDRDRSDETKHATKTSEFWIYVGLVVGLVIAASTASDFGVNRLWLFLTLLTIGYFLSRGLAKALRGKGAGDETKPSFKTTELWILALALVALFITGLATSDTAGELDNLDAARVWFYATLLGVGYLLSRGLAKSGAGARASSNGHGGASITDRARAAAEAFSGGEGGSRGGGAGRV